MIFTKYTPQICESCGQSITYILAIDKGTVEIVRAIALFIEKKGINIVHPRKEMENIGLLTSNQVGNLSRARLHGLIAKVTNEESPDKSAGNYCLTRKGGQFLNHVAVPREAIILKGKANNNGLYERNIGYVDENDLVKINEFSAKGEYWIGINYEITEGQVITRLPAKLI